MKHIYKVPSIKVVSFKVENGFESIEVEVAAGTGTQQLNLINNDNTPWYQEHQD